MGTLAWLNKPFLLRALKGAVDIEDFKVLPPARKGNHLLSDVRKAVVYWNDGRKQKTLLFFKIPRPEFERMAFTEIEIYASVLPKMFEVLNGNELCPTFYYCLKPENILVLEDLTESGFQMARLNSLIDYEHCEFALRAIAKFHAASMAVQKKHPGLIEGIGSGGVGGRKSFLELMVVVSLRVLAEILESCPGISSYSEKVNNSKQDVINGVLDLFVVKGTKNVLNHGDFTVNNTMFRYGENNEICDVRLFDFQLPCFTSFALDLQTFLLSSARADVLVNRLDDLLKIYHTALNSTLSDCGCSVAVTLEEVQHEFLKADCFGLFAACTLRSMRAAGEKASEMSSFDISLYNEKNDSPFRKLLELDEYKNTLPDILEYFENRGLFDIKK